MLKLFNALLLSVVLAFGTFFGLKTYQTNMLYAQNDDLFRQKIEDENKALQDKIINDIKISESNKSNNYSDITNPRPGENIDAEVSFDNARDMIAYASDKIANSKSVYSTISGSATLEGSATIAAIPPTKMSFTGTRARSKTKERDQRFFGYGLKGQIIGFNVNLGGEFYSADSVIYQIKTPGEAPATSHSKDEFESQLDWDMTSVFHFANGANVRNMTFLEEEFMYVSRTKEYRATVVIDTSNNYSSNFVNVIKGTAGDAVSWKEININSLKVSVVVDNKGNFKEIHYQDDIEVEMAMMGISAKGRLVTDYKEKFVNVGTGRVDIEKPVWA